MMKAVYAVIPLPTPTEQRDLDWGFMPPPYSGLPAAKQRVGLIGASAIRLSMTILDYLVVTIGEDGLSRVRR